MWKHSEKINNIYVAYIITTIINIYMCICECTNVRVVSKLQTSATNGGRNVAKTTH